jgi:integrase
MGFATKRDAERALAGVVSSIHGGTHVSRSALTLADYLVDEWLVATRPPRVRPETWEDRRRNLALHVVPRIGGVPLQELGASHLNRLYATLLEEGRIDGAGGLSPTSVRRIHSMLRKALNDAVRWGFVARNVTELADAPPARLAAAARRRSMRTWTASELQAFLAATSREPLHPLWVVAATTGLRRSELLGLRWSDVDLAAGTVTVRSTVLADGEGQYHLVEDQKSRVSARTLHVDPRTVEVLHRQRRVVEAVRDQVGSGWRDHGLVFPREDGRWWNPPAITLAFGRALRRSGAPRIRFHDLRHTSATLLLRAGVNPKVVSERLGHSSVAFTLDTYAHVIPGMQPEAAALLSDLIFAAPDPEDRTEDPS